MQETINKVKTYLGFAIKSGSILFGYDNIIKKQHKVKLIIVCSQANDKTLKNIKIMNKPTLKLTNLTLAELVDRKNVKVVGLTNENLSKAINENLQIFEKLN